ncbi:chemotaxis-specific protein-glutamate methyltransferase CheB [Persephonella sp.]
MINIVIVDDSSTVRAALKKILGDEKDIKIVGIASNGAEAVELVEKLRPDVITLDIEMPVMNGLEALEQIKRISPGTKIIMLSSLTEEGAEITFEALKKGADDFITKPSSFMDLFRLKKDLVTKIRSLSSYKRELEPKPLKTSISPKFDDTPMIGIGASTGGPQVVSEILSGLNKNINAFIVVAIHMPEGFTHTFAKRLNQSSQITVKEGESGEILTESVAYIIKGGKNMVVENYNGKKILKSINKESRFVPSIDLLLSSIAHTTKKNSIGIILSGMGNDGSEGVVEIKKYGGYNIAQNPDNCVLPSMPENAIKTGSVDLILDPEKITEFLNNL